MGRHAVTVFRPYPFRAGQRIRIEGGPRGGDWEVAEVTEGTVTLRCPLSGRRFEWKRFCYHVEDLAEAEWPRAE